MKFGLNKINGLLWGVALVITLIIMAFIQLW